MTVGVRATFAQRTHPPDTHDGNEWKLHDCQNWRRRVYQPAAKAAARVKGDLRVYRLRGSFVSLLLWEGRSLTFLADQAGHSVATLAKHYAGVLEELEDKPRTPAADAIREARSQRSSTGTELRHTDAGPVGRDNVNRDRAPSH
jgi:hypothetical protein